MTEQALEAPPIGGGDEKDELRRWTPEEVIKNKWLPYTSARVLKDKVRSGEVIGHRDGGRITFTLEDIRRQNERTTVNLTPRRRRAA